MDTGKEPTVKSSGVTWLPESMVEDCWDTFIKAHIEPALSSSGYTIEDVHEGLMRSLWRVMVAVHEGEPIATCLYRIVDFPAVRSLHVFALGGSQMELWLDDLIFDLRVLARGHHCDIITCSCRLGLSKILGDKGWRMQHVTMGLPLDG